MGEGAKGAGPEAKKYALPVPKDTSSVTHHKVTIDGVEIPYTATAGTLLIQTGDDPMASMFYVAYTKDGLASLDNRPVTFLYNGGPGSPSFWLHMGSYGPRMVKTSNALPTGPAPYSVVENPNSLLDRSDLVFIDAVGTGFSRLAGKGTVKDFYGTDGDAQAFAKFITRYVTLNKRWNSPKFLFGESYGTLRSAALVYLLGRQGMNFNGVVLLSTVLDYSTLISPVMDQPFEDMLPTFAAVAWYHKKLPHMPADFSAFLQEVRDFAAGEYSQALAKGQSISPAQEDAVAAKMHEYTGISVQFIKEAKLRLEPDRFRKELLRGEARTVGRYDGRFEGIDFDSAGEGQNSDPSETSIRGAFTAAFNSYLADDLKFSHDTPYLLRNPEIAKNWKFEHMLPSFRGDDRPYPLAYTIDDLAQAMRENPHLKVLSANGYFDSATPFFGTERDLNHMQLDPTLMANLSITYYPSGHMVYLNPEAQKLFKADLATFYDKAVMP
jgi:carboxypeptidase C (cathepsin A)